MKTKLFINFIYFMLSIISAVLIFNQNYVDRDFSKVDIDSVDNLMIVAHPDDEVLWGGAHLLREKYLVVCITCGQNITRVNEFKKTMDKIDTPYIMLGYPDKILNIRSNWTDEKDNIYDDLNEIMSLKNWKKIVTHNKNGEYGHIHHIMTHEIVLNIYNDSNNSGDLYFFGKYYTKSKLKKLKNKPIPITDKELKEKEELIDIYKTQYFIKDMFNQMNQYEDWILYENIVSMKG